MTLNIDDSAVKRINELKSQQNKENLFLRIRVEGGGCSGFKYVMVLSENKDDSDIVFNKCIITDETSLLYLNNAIISFEESLIGSDFKIENPNAKSGCGCGTSFSVI